MGECYEYFIVCCSLSILFNVDGLVFLRLPKKKAARNRLNGGGGGGGVCQRTTKLTSIAAITITIATTTTIIGKCKISGTGDVAGRL